MAWFVAAAGSAHLKHLPLGVIPSRVRIINGGYLMKTVADNTGLTLSDSPGCFMLFGTFFIVINVMSIIAILSSMPGPYTNWQILIALLLSLAVMGTGIFIIYRAPSTQIKIIKSKKMMNIRKRGLFKNTAEKYELKNIKSAYILKGKDIDGGPVYSMRLELIDGKVIPITNLWIHDINNLENTLSKISEYLPVEEMKESDNI
jgi:hypothetical protein